MPSPRPSRPRVACENRTMRRLVAGLLCALLAVVVFATYATAAIALISLTVLKKRCEATVMGLTLLFLPALPTLLVPYLPTRYTASPYAGFLLLMAAAYRVAHSKLATSLRRITEVGLR